MTPLEWIGLIAVILLVVGYLRSEWKKLNHLVRREKDWWE